MEENQPQVTWHLTDMLLSYVGEVLDAEGRLDYPALFRGAEDLDIPSNLKSYLSERLEQLIEHIVDRLEVKRIDGPRHRSCSVETASSGSFETVWPIKNYT